MTLPMTKRPGRTPGASVRRWAFMATFYGGLVLLMVLILSGGLGAVLPAELARRIGYNSEGYALAVLLAAWIQFVLPRLHAGTRWAVTLLVAGLSLALGAALVSSDLPSSFTTLNEAFFALGLVLPYLALTRPLPRWPALLSTALLVLVVLGVATSSADSPVVRLAETLVVLILMPLAFDLVDRGILDPAARTSAVLRCAWYAALVIIPIVVVLLGNDVREGGGVHAVLQYIGRVHEAVIGVLLVQLYFAVALGRRGRSRH